MGAGVPAGWERIAQLVRDRYNRELQLLHPPNGFDTYEGTIDVYLDGELIGAFQFLWSDDDPQEDVLDELQSVLSELLVQDLKDELGRS